MRATDAGAWSIRNSTATTSTRTTTPTSTRSTSRAIGSSWPGPRGSSAAPEADPERFMVAPDLYVEMTRSWPYLRHNLIHDLAALNKVEMILWDTWGLMEQEHLAERELGLLDLVANATASADPDHSELRRLYEEPVLRVPGRVTSYSPLSGELRQVTLKVARGPTTFPSLVSVESRARPCTAGEQRFSPP